MTIRTLKLLLALGATLGFNLIHFPKYAFPKKFTNPPTSFELKWMTCCQKKKNGFSLVVAARQTKH
jgi:hypothetical protein